MNPQLSSNTATPKPQEREWWPIVQSALIAAVVSGFFCYRLWTTPVPLETDDESSALGEVFVLICMGGFVVISTIVGAVLGLGIRGLIRRQTNVRFILLFIAAFLAICLLVGWLRSTGRIGATVWKEDRSPYGGRFSLRVMSQPMLFSFPGGGSDAPGIIQLIDNQSGRLLRTAPVEMVQLVERVEWTCTNVSVRLVVEWPLPSTALK
jgi:hypothetical protein